MRRAPTITRTTRRFNARLSSAGLDRTFEAPLNKHVHDTLQTLAATIAARRGGDPTSSYVAKLIAAGAPFAARKLGEEAVETIVAALSGNADALTSEAADLVFHLLVLLETRGVPFAEVLGELDRRAGVSGIAEKAGREA